VACGVPLFVAAIAGTHGRSSALAWAWWATIVALDLSGKNLGEVARLWIFLTPFAVPPAAAAFERLGSLRWPVFVLQVLLALQTIVFIANVQGFFDPRSIEIPGRARAESRGRSSLVPLAWRTDTHLQACSTDGTGRARRIAILLASAKAGNYAARCRAGNFGRLC
jgi:hypothetical protein